MIILKSLIAIISFLFSCLGVALIVGAIVVFSVKPNPTTPGFFVDIFDFNLGITVIGARGIISFGIGTAWWNLPGTVLGVLAGIQSAKVSLKKK